MAELIILGTGTCSVTARRSMAAAALLTEVGLLLVDCGPGAIRRLAEAGLSVHDVRTIAMTHLHTDHVADLGPLLFCRKYDPAAPTPPVRMELWGPRGFAAHFELLEKLHAGRLYSEGDAPKIIEVVPGPGGAREAPGSLRIEARRMVHSDLVALGYRVEAEGKIVAFSGDTGPCDALVDLARDADVFVCECSFPDDAAVAGHLTPEEVGRTAGRAACSKVVLTHMYPAMEGVDARAIIGRHFDGEVVCGEDGMRIPLE